MDTSKEYISMCERFPVENIFQLGDFFYSYDLEKVDILVDFEQLIGKLVPTKLYRQDQLQEMVWEDVIEKDPLRKMCAMSQKPELLTIRFKRFVMGNVSFLRLTSMEQLWLAFVMQEKFGKMWTGEDWAAGR